MVNDSLGIGQDVGGDSAVGCRCVGQALTPRLSEHGQRQATMGADISQDTTSNQESRDLSAADADRVWQYVDDRLSDVDRTAFEQRLPSEPALMEAVLQFTRVLLAASCEPDDCVADMDSGGGSHVRRHESLPDSVVVAVSEQCGPRSPARTVRGRQRQGVVAVSLLCCACLLIAAVGIRREPTGRLLAETEDSDPEATVSPESLSRFGRLVEFDDANGLFAPLDSDEPWDADSAAVDIEAELEVPGWLFAALELNADDSHAGSESSTGTATDRLRATDPF